MKMVAELSGVDRTTVSRVLNGRFEPGRYPPQTVARIRRAARKLGYRKNLAALTLKGGRSLTIGLVVADISIHFFATVASHLDRLCRESGYGLLICNAEENPDVELEVLRSMHDRMVDGVIVSPASVNTKHLRELSRKGVAVVLFDRASPSSDLPAVTADNFGGATRAVERLLDWGHRVLGLVGGFTEDPSIADRVRGFRDALRRHGVRVARDRVACECASEADAESAAEAMLSTPKRPSAIFSATAACSVGVIRAAHRLHLRIPQDLSLIGFDDFQAADLLDPPIDVVCQPTEAIAAEAYRMLMAQVVQTRRPKITHRVLPVEVVTRGSCGPPPR